MKRILSYVYPFTRKIQSEYNGEVEITWSNGQKLLDSQHANYSYGSLQRILKFGLEQIDLHGIVNVLLLGLGGGSVIKTLRNDFNCNAKITAIEIDRVLIDIASTEFDIHESENLHIFHMDANQYVHESQEVFDLVIVDLFIDLNVPDIFYTTSFWTDVVRLIPTKGYLIFNSSISGNGNPSLATVITELRESFIVQQHNRVEGTNTLIVGQRLEL